jgi:ATP-dependent Clp protease, protease subunit
LLTACRSLMSEIDQTSHTPMWDTIDLAIACGGGDVISGCAAYNGLKSLPIKFVTHNIGAVDSAAILVFMAGQQRYANAFSGFLFHQIAWNFAAKDNIPITTLHDASEWMHAYEKLMSELVSAKTQLSTQKVVELMRDGTLLTPEEAKKLGVIDDIREHSIPQNARWAQV